MGALAIRAVDLTKRYRLDQVRRRDVNLRELIADGLSARNARRLFGRRGPRVREFWALKGVSFDVEHGESVGIIGRNGAGKSTLLKILSRVTRPTSGTAAIHGRMGSLLEVGTGFHPDLTGRENIYLNGAILGMKRAEIRRKFDEIVAFAEVETFLETPVKRYSSGMYVRLAFAVAAHLSFKILVVDEVLAVGDAVFQQRCLGKMGEAARSGRTVLFVSHNLAAVHALCHRVLLVEDGLVTSDGPADTSIGAYLRSIEVASALDLARREDRHGNGQARLVRVRVTGGDGLSPSVFATGRPMRLVFEYDGVVPGMTCSFTFYDPDGVPVAVLNSGVHGPEDVRDAGLGPAYACEIEELPLLPGRYRINVAAMAGGDLIDHVEGAKFFEVGPGQMRGRPETSHHGYGSVCIAHRWRQPTCPA
jgi:lipopolysaccharide transport system ATP-binding protein